MRYSEQSKQRQIELKQLGFYKGAIDGYFGKLSQAAEKLYEASTKDSILNFDGTVNKRYLLPYTDTQDKLNYFGAIGKNQVFCYPAYPLFLSWDTSIKITRFSCHKKIKTSVEAALQAIHCAYGTSKLHELKLDLFGGCLNVRTMRGGEKPSSHSWGAAVDWDTANNRLHERPGLTNMARPENKNFCDIMLRHNFKTLSHDLQHWEFDITSAESN